MYAVNRLETPLYCLPFFFHIIKSPNLKCGGTGTAGTLLAKSLVCRGLRCSTPFFWCICHGLLLSCLLNV